MSSCVDAKRGLDHDERGERLALHAAGLHHLAAARAFYHPHAALINPLAMLPSPAALARFAPGAGGRLAGLPHPLTEQRSHHRPCRPQPPRNPNKPLTPFFITDILSGRAKKPATPPATGDDRPATPRSLYSPRGFVRPWAGSIDDDEDGHKDDDDDDDEVDDDVEIEVDDDRAPTTSTKSCSPLDALFQMTSKTFDPKEGRNHAADDAAKKDALGLFAKSQPPKKRRKSRTAFSNQQIYELEKRFLYQKYLTPADRDDIAASLALTNAQVITWFQNRRAKLKRDLEEIKNDMSAAKTIQPRLCVENDGRAMSPTHPALLVSPGAYVPEPGEICRHTGPAPNKKPKLSHDLANSRYDNETTEVMESTLSVSRGMRSQSEDEEVKREACDDAVCGDEPGTGGSSPRQGGSDS